MAKKVVTDFVTRIFNAKAQDEFVCIARPSDDGYWQQKFDETIEFDKDSWYVCVSTVKPPERGTDGKPKVFLRRRRQDCLRAYVVMLDDIGTKVQEEHVPVDPAYVIETSKGNFQYIYLIEPHDLTEDGGMYEACIKTLADSGYTDRGALGQARVFRLPGSLNQKRGKKWNAVVSNRDNTRWKLSDLMEAFNITEAEIAENMPSAQLIPSGKIPTEDVLFEWLQENSLMLRDKGAWVDVPCPWGEGHTAGKKDPAGYSPLGRGDQPFARGFYCFHESCQQYGIQEFLDWAQRNNGPIVGVLEAIGDEHIALLKEEDGAAKYDLLRGELPKIDPNMLPDVRMGAKGPLTSQPATRSNVNYILSMYGATLQFNMQARMAEFSFQDKAKGALVSSDKAIFRHLVDGCLMAGMNNTTMVYDIIREMSIENRYHPVQDWVLSKPWDGVDRFKLLAKSVKPDAGSKTAWPFFLRRWLIQTIQAIAGWESPQAVGQVLVIAGRQGIGKTRWFGSLMPREFFSESVHLNLSMKHVDSVLSSTQTPIAELGELEVTFKRSEVGALKAFLTSAYDTYRPPYGRDVISVPRTTSFCATVNRTGFLDDPTGARRFWPISAISLNPEHGVDPQQLWAQVHTWWKQGEIWWLNEEEEGMHAMLISSFSAPSEVEDKFTAYFQKHEHLPKDLWRPFTATEIAERLSLSTAPATLGTLRYLIELKFGEPKTIEGVRRSWLLPDAEVAAFDSIPEARRLG